MGHGGQEGQRPPEILPPKPTLAGDGVTPLVCLLSGLQMGGGGTGEVKFDAASVTKAGMLALSEQARPERKSASRSLRRALLTPQVNPGSLFRCGNERLRAGFGPRQGQSGPGLFPKPTRRTRWSPPRRR